MTPNITHKYSVLTRAVLGAVFLLFAAAAAPRAGDPPKLMVFDTEFLDLMVSGTGESFTTAEDISRAKTISDAFRKELAGRYKIIRPKKDVDPYDLSCPECILKVAKAQGAELVLTSALSRMNSRVVILKYELGDVTKDKRLVSGDFALNGFTTRQINLASDAAIKNILKGGKTETGAAPQ